MNDKEYWNLWRKEWRKRNPHKAKEYYDKHKHSPERKIKALLRASTVDRSSLSFDYIWNRLQENQFKCEITGKEFTWGSLEPTSLSIDRINPTKGYTTDNIRLVCWWINAAMGTWGIEKLKELIKEWNV